MSRLLLLVLVVLVLVVAFRLARRPRIVIRVFDGTASVVRGSPSQGLLREIGMVARHAPAADGRVEISGRIGRVELWTPGLEEDVAQRVRNVVYLYADRLE